jgi:hypothetical protein
MHKFSIVGNKYSSFVYQLFVCSSGDCVIMDHMWNCNQNCSFSPAQYKSNQRNSTGSMELCYQTKFGVFKIRLNKEPLVPMNKWLPFLNGPSNSQGILWFCCGYLGSKIKRHVYGSMGNLNKVLVLFPRPHFVMHQTDSLFLVVENCFRVQNCHKEWGSSIDYMGENCLFFMLTYLILSQSIKP